MVKFGIYQTVNIFYLSAPITASIATMLCLPLLKTMPPSEENTPQNPLRRALLRGIPLAALPFCLPSSLLAVAIKHPSQQVSKAELVRLIARETGIAKELILRNLHDAHFTPSIITRITTPYESRSYSEYRPLFLTNRLKKMGHQYLTEQQAIFTKVEKKYHVEPMLIAAILGMETHYGRNRGRDRIVDSLYTLATGFPRRANFFRRELGEFMLLSQEEGRDASRELGSYAGAFGSTQFIPSSFRAYAVDADGDGKRNVWDSPDDIIASVANYFNHHGWQHGRPCAYWLPVSAALTSLAKTGFDTWQPLAKLRQHLPDLPAIWRDNDKVSIIEMRPKQGRRFALVHYNFYVITRWNRSYNYAMAATELAALLGDVTFAVS
ncbi:MAG: lytic murein transglycosylase [Mariprofundus sp.]|nr:lytic murein transglycosylase [Mariprofundus sp.]